MTDVGLAAARAPDQTERARRRALQRSLQLLVGEALGAADLPPVDVGLFDLGLESLAAVEIRCRLEDELGIELDADLLLEEPTIATIAAVVSTAIGATRAERPG